MAETSEPLVVIQRVSLSPGGRPDEAAAELLERTPHPRPRFPAGGPRQRGLHPIGHRAAGELFSSDPSSHPPL